MPEETSAAASAKALTRIAQIRKELLEIDYVCSGTVVTTMNKCGRPNCACATDPAAKHGPYHQWGRMKDGKLIHTTVTPEQATRLKRAIKNYRRALRLLRAWEDQTARTMGIRRKRKSLKKREIN